MQKNPKEVSGLKHRKKKKIALIVGLCAVLSGLMGLVLWMWLWHPDIYINEISPSNAAGSKAALVTDRTGDTCDWIELYNAEDKKQSLDGFSLCKNGGETASLDGITVDAGEYLVVYCSKAGFEKDFDGAHADFNISKTGEDKISLLYNGSEVCTVELPQLDNHMTYSRDDKGSFYVSEPTPAEENKKETVGDTVRFSKQGGCYDKEFSLKLSAAKGQTIYYTTDGTDPETSDTRKKYKEPIKITDRKGDKNVLAAIDPQLISNNYNEDKVFLPKDEDVDKATVIRACAKGSSGKYGRTVTATYFVGDVVNNHNGLPIVSVVTDPDNLFDYDTGIYTLGKVFDQYKDTHDSVPKNGSVPANYNQRGREWEKECHIELYTENGWSRAEYQKSLRFYARGSYGAKSFEAPLFADALGADGKVIDEYDTLVLRNGGNDTNYSKFKDPMLQSMVSERLPDTQQTHACVLFIDGEYWGLYSLTQDYSENYFADKYGVDEDDVVCVKSGEVDVGLESDMAMYKEMSDFITQNSMSDDENYKKASMMLDMDNFAQYCATQMYIFNTDWPQNNYGCWRTRKIGKEGTFSDGRWRFYLFDTESSCNHYNDKYTRKSIFTYLNERSEEGIGPLITALIENKEFSMKLVTELMKLGNMNYSYENYKQTLSVFKDSYYAELANYYERFPTWAKKENACNLMLERMDSFFKGRMKLVQSALTQQFDLGKTCALTFEIEGKGEIYIDRTPIGEALIQEYFEGCSFTLNARAQSGWHFDHWEGIDGSEKQVSLTVSENITVKAVFVKDSSTAGSLPLKGA